MELSKKQIFIGAGAIAAATGIGILAIAKKRKNKKVSGNIIDTADEQLALTDETFAIEEPKLEEQLAIEESL